MKIIKTILGLSLKIIMILLLILCNDISAKSKPRNYSIDYPKVKIEISESFSRIKDILDNNFIDKQDCLICYNTDFDIIETKFNDIILEEIENNALKLNLSFKRVKILFKNKLYEYKELHNGNEKIKLWIINIYITNKRDALKFNLKTSIINTLIMNTNIKIYRYIPQENFYCQTSVFFNMDSTIGLNYIKPEEQYYLLKSTIAQIVNKKFNAIDDLPGFIIQKLISFEMEDKSFIRIYIPEEKNLSGEKMIRIYDKKNMQIRLFNKMSILDLEDDSSVFILLKKE